MSIKMLEGTRVILQEREYVRRENDNYAYMMSLDPDSLLFNYYTEAGFNCTPDPVIRPYGGWEAPTCQLRGHFLGHWLSAAAMRYYETGDQQLRSRADYIVGEIAKCQKENGDGWAGSIPEKYLTWLASGKQVWAPQYTVHKTWMGLLDMYIYAGNEQALQIADQWADWFYRWSGQYSREEFDNILDVETGGMLEIWAELYEISNDRKYPELMKRYYRQRLFEPLLQGKDVLTNRHANTTIPEILGCARAYEATGEENWLRIVEAYWKCAVSDRGCFATGGQTHGEVWTAPNRLKHRLGDKNQEHCTVYNMMRLADFLFCHTGDPVYLQYMEYNLRNGVFAQTYWKRRMHNGTLQKGLLTYFLPLKAGAVKDWSGETDSFFCCHGTMIQANSALNRGIWYEGQNRIYIGQYVDSAVKTGQNSMEILQHQDRMNGFPDAEWVKLLQDAGREIGTEREDLPDCRRYDFLIHSEVPAGLILCFRVPEWSAGKVTAALNGNIIAESGDSGHFIEIDRVWENGDLITVTIPVGLRFVPLPDDPDTGAFRYGPDVLAGLCSAERILYINDDPVQELSVDRERQWDTFQTCFRTENQDPGIDFVKLNEVGYDPYQVYFHTVRR